MSRRWLSFLLMAPMVAVHGLRRWTPLALGPAAIGTGGWAQARVLLSQDAALRKAFPAAQRVERKTLFLTDAQARRIQERAQARVDSLIVTYYEGMGASESLGRAFFETRIVRTMPVTFMTVVDPGGALRFVEVLAFHEPDDYLPRPAWLALYARRRLSDGLRLRRDIPNVTGASLTCHTINDGVRVSLAIDDLLRAAPGATSGS
jgi:hypothetical protein